MKTGAQVLCESLINEGVEVIFGISGGTVIPMYDAFSEYPQIRRVLVRHEQAAAHAAAGYARVKHRAGVCVGTSGPGATNLVTGIADAYMDSTPMVVITGQVACSFIGKDAAGQEKHANVTSHFQKSLAAKFVELKISKDDANAPQLTVKEWE